MPLDLAVIGGGPKGAAIAAKAAALSAAGYDAPKITIYEPHSRSLMDRPIRVH